MKWIQTGMMILTLLAFSCKGGEKAQKGNEGEKGNSDKEIKAECMAITKGGKPVFDSFELARQMIEGDCITFYVMYQGGCQDHTFELQWNGSWMKSLPPQVNLTLSHNGNRDVCREQKQLELRYDLSSLKMDGQNQVNINLSTGLDSKPQRVEYMY